MDFDFLRANVRVPFLGSTHQDEVSATNTEAAPPWGGLYCKISDQRPDQAVFRFPADSLPVRRSDSISYEIFCPSTNPRRPARSRADAWTKTSLPPLSG